MTYPIIILVTPQLGENIGACARAMANFDLTTLRLVNPRDGWPNERAWTLSSGATTLIRNAEVFPTLEEAIADLQFVFATTARKRDFDKPVYTPEQAARVGVRKQSQGLKTGILFGRERWGLTNDEIVFSDAMITFPTSPHFSSVNLAQSVLLCGYEWFKNRTSDAPPSGSPDTEPASKKEIILLSQHLERALDAVGYFMPEEKRPASVFGLQKLLANAGFSAPDVQRLRGVITALERGRKEW